MIRLVVPALAAILVASACTEGGQRDRRIPPEELPVGGELTLATVGDVGTAGLDPQKERSPVAWALFRCCLLRTLMAFPGRPATTGGAEPRPDLAARQPEISDDGRTWTFRIRNGVRYAPPFQNREVQAEDFIRALERLADPRTGDGGPFFYYEVIDGFTDLRAGKAGTITGLRAPNPRTLVIRLTQATGDLGLRMALPPTAPIPPRAAEGHADDYGRFLGASGPYMIQGSRRLNPGAEDPKPVPGYRPGRSLALIRNPSWKRNLDPVRPAFVDRITIAIGTDPEENAALVDGSDLHMQLDGFPPPPQIRKYRNDPQLRERLFVHTVGILRYLAVRIAVPPFDDVHVRRAVNLALDKDAVRRALGGAPLARIAGHLFPSLALDGKLAGFDPYATPDHAGDPDAARREMERSRYDEDGDGLCDGNICRGVPLAVDVPALGAGVAVARSLQRIGIEVEPKLMSTRELLGLLREPRRRIPLILAPPWRMDFPDPVTVARPLLAGSTVDDQIRGCERAVGPRRATCWAGLDRTVMNQIVPWVPLVYETNADVVAGTVVKYAFDQFTGLAALDRIAITKED